jgi:putative acetyltransferase
VQEQSRFIVLEGDPREAEAAVLISRHLADMSRHTPPESIHALDVEGLCAPDVTFWTVRDGVVLVGCGALKQLDPTQGEIKSMHTAATHLRKGIASTLLEHIIHVARRRGYARLSLETGSMDAYAAARSLYARFGFEICGPFGGYDRDPNSTFMTREL